MRSFAILPVVVAVMTLSACSSGGHNSVSTIPSVVETHVAQRSGPHVAYAVIHSFGGPGDGATPYASLFGFGKTLYGTTVHGGAHGKGTVFSIAPSGTETVLHSFSGSDGAAPFAELINVNGTLYGTTAFGGTHNKGTVFSITPSGTETVVYSFRGGANDGENPDGGLLYVDGTLYGTTTRGGDANTIGWGIVFSVTPSGTETLLHRFAGSGNGAVPHGSLILGPAIGGSELYGTTERGGAYDVGSVFEIDPSGDFALMHSFGWIDGAHPHAGLVKLNGTLYGTSTRGGPYDDRGTIFSFRPARPGEVAVLHDFTHSGDGANPLAPLVYVAGTLYGTTKDGGANAGGTIFSISPDAHDEIVLHSFGGSGDGGLPYAGLVEVGGKLYGTTSRGGANDKGIVFSITP